MIVNEQSKKKIQIFMWMMHTTLIVKLYVYERTIDVNGNIIERTSSG